MVACPKCQMTFAALSDGNHSDGLNEATTDGYADYTLPARRLQPGTKIALGLLGVCVLIGIIGVIVLTTRQRPDVGIAFTVGTVWLFFCAFVLLLLVLEILMLAWVARDAKDRGVVWVLLVLLTWWIVRLSI
jgi:hypothetical protein